MRGSHLASVSAVQSDNFKPRKPATVAKLAGHGSRTGQAGQDCGACGAGVARMAFAGKRKWEEMKSYRQSQPLKTARRYASQIPVKLFSLLFSLCNPLK